MLKRTLASAGVIVPGTLATAAVANSAYYAVPSWSQKIARAVGNRPRFIALADRNREAVLARETGLVCTDRPGRRRLASRSLGSSPWPSATTSSSSGSVADDTSNRNRVGRRLPPLFRES